MLLSYDITYSLTLMTFCAISKPFHLCSNTLQLSYKQLLSVQLVLSWLGTFHPWSIFEGAVSHLIVQNTKRNLRKSRDILVLFSKSWQIAQIHDNNTFYKLPLELANMGFLKTEYSTPLRKNKICLININQNSN